MLLSIVMMVKNEERYLNKTLSQLLPLMDQIYSELIILDTGSEDSTVEIAKKYTNHVYYSKWNGNFSDMRNKSISYASGEWILILDADEQLTNFEKMIEFFNTNLCKTYNSATIELKNIFSEDEKKYSISSILRLFRNQEGFRYKGAIHEQPVFNGPIYNDIASFNHYGYMFIDEEIRQLKADRNKNILLEEISKKPNDPYTNYQLGKSCRTCLNNEEAKFYMEKAYNLYNIKSKSNHIPIFVVEDLAKTYISLGDYIECETLCSKYIKKDNKNIDIYYYLATSKMLLCKYEESLKYYNRYIYLLDNYSITTQANSMESSADTIIHRNKCKINIIQIYYKLHMFDKVVKEIENMDFDDIKHIYDIVFLSLYKLNSVDKIYELYNKIENSLFEKAKFIDNLESILVKVKEEDKYIFYKLFSDIDGDYGILNKVRLGEKISLNLYNEILKEENKNYYGELLYYANKDGLDIEDILKGVSYLKMQNYIDYIIIKKRDCIIELYNYLQNVKNTLEINKLHIYSCLSKSLLMYGNLIDDKYNNLFFMYITYRYYCIKLIYDQKLSDEDRLIITTDSEDEFILKINIIENMKYKDELKYIKEIKKLLVENQKYKKGIELLINNFETELNQNHEMKELRLKYKSILERNINIGNIDQAEIMISEYESMFSSDIEILNMKAIIQIMGQKFDVAEITLKNAFILKNNDYNTIFNIAYLKECTNEIDEAIRFYTKIVNNCKEEEIVLEAKEKINLLTKID